MENIIKEDFLPKQAIIIYHRPNSYYLELRKVLKSGVLGAGTPLKEKTLSKIMETIKTNDIQKVHCSTFLPKNLLYFTNENFNTELIWYMKPSKRQVSFKESLGIDDGIMHTPTLVFHLKNKVLRVFATKSVRPDKNTVLYRAPFHNTGKDGGVCLGNAKVRKSNEVNEIMKAYEDVFFQSKFSEIHGGSPIKGNINTFLQKHISKQLKFDNNVLTPYNRKIKDLV